MCRLFLQFLKYLHFKKSRKDNSLPALFLRNHGLPVGSEFPGLMDAIKHIKSKEFDGMIVLFLSTTCQTCIEFFTKIEYLKEKWSTKGILIFVNGNNAQFNKIHKEHQLKIPLFQYELAQFQIYRTTIFPYMYYLSNQGMILSQGAVNGTEQIDVIVSKENEGV
ncbi:hypothetical protein D3C74_344370 [compost metagenome]